MRGLLIIARLILDMACLFTKFDDFSFKCSEDIKEGLKCKNWYNLECVGSLAALAMSLFDTTHTTSLQLVYIG